MALILPKRRLLVKLVLLVIVPVLLLLLFVFFIAVFPLSTVWVWVGALVATLGYGLFAFLFLMAFTRRFEKVEEVSKLLAEGKLDEPFHQNGQDEVPHRTY